MTEHKRFPPVRVDDDEVIFGPWLDCQGDYTAMKRADLDAFIQSLIALRDEGYRSAIRETIDANPSCQHSRVNPESGRCVECDEQMIAVKVAPETVLSAPNLAGCRNPACLAALDDGTYDDADPPAGCTNQHGMYIPDRSREREITLGWHYDYECERCRNDGTIMASGSPIIWDCGKRHRAYVSARESA